MAKRSIEVNAWGGLVHRVPEGLLLVWPDLFRSFRLAFAAALGPTGVLLVAWTVDWAFVAHVWPGRVEGLLAQELATVVDDNYLGRSTTTILTG